jgi:hypothetical protein
VTREAEREQAVPQAVVAPPAPVAPVPTAVATVLSLQRNAGNALVARALAPSGQLVLARQHVQLVSGRYVGDLEGAEANVREDVIGALERLLHLWSIDVADFNAEVAAVKGKPANARLTVADLARTIAALKRNESQSLAKDVANSKFGLSLGATVAAGGSNAKADVLALLDALHANWNIDNADYGREFKAVTDGGDPVDNGKIPATLKAIAAFKSAYVAGTSRRHGPLAGTKMPSAQGVADREAATITPGTATVTTTTPSGVTETKPVGFQDKVKVGGVERTYRQDLWAELDTVVGYMFPRSDAMLKRPKMAMSVFETIGDAAKNCVDGIWGTYGAFGPRFHTGVNLFDASLRTGDADDMIRYLVDNQQELNTVRARHNAVHAAGRPETAIRDKVRTDYVAHGTNKHKLEIIDQGWPALNAGGRVSIQPFEGKDAAATRRVRWKAFQTMIHEYFHSLNHPNYYRLADELGGDERSVLVEGGASLMTDLTWKKIYPAGIKANASLRTTVEGSALPFDGTVIPPITESHYTDQWHQCQAIEKAVGPENFRVAFLTGRVELLGYTQALPGSKAGATSGQTFTVPPTGVKTLADVAYRTRTSVEDLARLNGKAANAAVRPGDVLAVRGTP